MAANGMMQDLFGALYLDEAPGDIHDSFEQAMVFVDPHGETFSMMSEMGWLLSGAEQQHQSL